MHIKWEPPPTGTRLMLIELIAKEMVSQLVAGYLEMQRVALFNVFILIMVAIILKGLKFGVYFMLCVLLVISTLIVLFFKLILLLLQLLSLIVLPQSLISNLFLEDVLNLLHLQDWYVSIQHCFRKSNSCADLLAKKEFDALFSPVLVIPNCNFLHGLLVLDCKGVSISCLVT
jgi:hypothetical protein